MSDPNPLTFPTLAEQAVTRFRESTVTISLVTICNEMGATREVMRLDNRKVIVYTFDDDSSLEIRGVGKNHDVRTFYP